MGICKADCIWVEGENVMPELNFRLKISGGKRLETKIDIIPQSLNGNKKITLNNGMVISEQEIAKDIEYFFKNRCVSLEAII